VWITTCNIDAMFGDNGDIYLFVKLGAFHPTLPTSHLSPLNSLVQGNCVLKVLIAF